MRYKVLKEFLTVKNPHWLAPGEIIDGQPTGARIKALLDKGYIEEIPEQPKTVWDLKKGDEYYAISFDGCVTHEHINEVTLDYHERVIGIGNAFLTKEEAEKELVRRKAKVILERDTRGFEPDWYNILQHKYDVYYDYVNCKLSVCTYSICSSHQSLWFATKEDAEASIKTHSNEWKTYLGVESVG